LVLYQERVEKRERERVSIYLTTTTRERV
jgi:hypothetical protein